MYVWVERVSHEPLDSALTMAHVYDLGNASFLKDEVQVCRHIELAHFVEGKVPELALLVRVVAMHVGEDSASVIGDPHIVAQVHELQSQRIIPPVEQPRAAVVTQSMLHVHWLFTFPLLLVQSARHSKQGQHVTVLCQHFVGLKHVTLLGHLLI